MALNADLARYNRQLDDFCHTHWGISVRTYKIIKAMTQLVGTALAFYAISEGADPLTVFLGVTFIIGGPEAFEYIVTHDNTD